MKAIIFSDIHFHSWAKYNEENKRLKAQLDFMESLVKLAFENKVPIFFGGDMFMDPFSLKNGLLSVVLPRIQEMFFRYPVELFAISGNHDLEGDNSIGRRSPSYINTLANVIDRFQNIDFSEKDFGKFKLYGIPYLRGNQGLMEYANDIKLDPNKFNILMLHTSFKGQVDTGDRPVNGGENLSDRGLSRFNLVVAGDIHKPSHVRTNIFSIGAPMQLRLSDMGGSFGYWILTDVFKMEFVEVTDTPKYRFFKDPSEVDNSTDIWIKAPKDDDEIEQLVSSNFDLTNRKALVKAYLDHVGKGKAKVYFKFLWDLISEIDG